MTRSPVDLETIRKFPQIDQTSDLNSDPPLLEQYRIFWIHFGEEKKY